MRWAGQQGKPVTKTLDDETKSEVVRFGVQQNSWVAAARMFDKPVSTVADWGWKAG